MIKKKKILIEEDNPGFEESIEQMPADSKIFVDKSMEIAHFILQLMDSKGMRQKDLAQKMGKSEAEISKLLAGMHNYTLRSLSKLEAALGATIICTPRLDLNSGMQASGSVKASMVLDKPEPYKPVKVNYAPVVQMFETSAKELESQAI